MKYCEICKEKGAKLQRCKTRKLLCLDCFFQSMEEEVHQTIIHNKMFQKGQKIVIGASGGKDSTVLIHILNLLNKKHDYGLELLLLSIDEGIKGYRDDSLETVKSNAKCYGLPLMILSFKELFGWTMDEVVAQMGMKQSCTYCGVFRRQALDRGAFQLKADWMATGHNADDLAETLLMNMLRGDIQRIGRTVQVSIGRGEDDLHLNNNNNNTDAINIVTIPRCKPFKYLYEKEIVLYAHYQKLEYFSTECTYFPGSYRGGVRDLVKKLEQVRPSTIVDIIHSGEQMTIIKDKEGGFQKDSQLEMQRTKVVKQQQWKECKKCQFPSSNPVCKACMLLDVLNKGKPHISINNTNSEPNANS